MLVTLFYLFYLCFKNLYFFLVLCLKKIFNELVF